ARPTPANPGGATKAAPAERAAGPALKGPQRESKGQEDPVQGKLAVSGQVVSADGKPVAGADVAVLGRAKLAARAGYSRSAVNKVLAAGKTDREGKFRRGATGVSQAAYWQIVLVARASGHGITQEQLPVEPGSVTRKVDLPRERVLRGRLVDLQGQ